MTHLKYLNRAVRLGIITQEEAAEQEEDERLLALWRAYKAEEEVAKWEANLLMKQETATAS